MLDTADLHRVAVIDDEPEARAGYADYLEDLGMEPVTEEGPLAKLDHFVELSRQRSDVAICDHRMKISGYAEFDGAELVSEYIKKKFPALLCTRFEDDIDEIRPYRKYIPILLNWEDLMDPDTIRLSFERLVAELRGKIPPSRRPWRTIVRVHDADHERGFVHVFLPSWNPHEGLRLRIQDLPPDVHTHLRAGCRMFAHVNIGAEKSEDLFFDRWKVG